MTSQRIEDIDSEETREWLEAFRAVIRADGDERAAFLLQQLQSEARIAGIKLVDSIRTSPYRNTIQPHEESMMPSSEGMAGRIAALIRWNAMAMVVRATRFAPELGGHIASYASASTLYE